MKSIRQLKLDYHSDMRILGFTHDKDLTYFKKGIYRIEPIIKHFKNILGFLDDYAIGRLWYPLANNFTARIVICTVKTGMRVTLTLEEEE